MESSEEESDSDCEMSNQSRQSSDSESEPEEGQVSSGHKLQGRGSQLCEQKNSQESQDVQ